jgi:hypothetical protein
VPRVVIVRGLQAFLEGELDALLPPGGSVRAVAHPYAWGSRDGSAPGHVGALARPASPGASARPGASAGATAGAAGAAAGCERLLVAVGPEGGWADDEVALLEARGFSPVGLGPRILRSDVAVVALLALAHHQVAAWDGGDSPGPVGEGGLAR